MQLNLAGAQVRVLRHRQEQRRGSDPFHFTLTGLPELVDTGGGVAELPRIQVHLDRSHGDEEVLGKRFQRPVVNPVQLFRQRNPHFGRLMQQHRHGRGHQRRRDVVADHIGDIAAKHPSGHDPFQQIDIAADRPDRFVNRPHRHARSRRKLAQCGFLQIAGQIQFLADLLLSFVFGGDIAQ